MNSKPWYTSKLVLLGILMTLLGVVPIVSTLASQQVLTPADVINAIGGVLVVILRVWFTDTAIQRP